MKAATFDNLAPDLESLVDEAAVMVSFVAGTPVDTEVDHRVPERAMAIREEIYRRHGLLNCGVPAIRELRGDLSDA